MTANDRRRSEKELMVAMAQPSGAARDRLLSAWASRWGWALLVKAAMPGVVGVPPNGSDAA